MTTSQLSKGDTLWLRDHVVGATGISVLIADAKASDSPIVDVNPAFLRLTGYDPSDVLGRNCRFLQGPGTDPEAVTRMRNGLEEARHSTVVLLNFRRDGTPFWNEVSISPIFDQSRNLTHFVGLQQDVTERERANRQLQLLGQSNDIITSVGSPRTILQAVADLMVPTFADYCTVHLRTVDDEITWLSTTGVDACVTGEIERLERSVPHPMDGNSGIATVMRTRETILREAQSEEMLVETARNDVHRELLQRHDWQATLIIPIRTSGHVFGTIHCSRTGAAFPFSAEELQLAETIGGRIGGRFEQDLFLHRARTELVARERFLSIAAHELRTPIASIKGYAQLLSRSLERGTLTPHRLRQGIHTVDASVSRLASLTDDLLAVSRRGSGDMPLRIDRIHTISFLASVVNRATMLYEQPVIVDSSSSAGHFLGDIARIDQVMTNLLSNAARFSDSDQPISIKATSDDGGVRIAVQDSGVGLTEDELKTIFELFGGSDRSLAPRLSGVGFGLFISRNIIERHGGRLWAESAGHGRGSSVTFWLPSSPQPDASADSDAARYSNGSAPPDHEPASTPS